MNQPELGKKIAELRKAKGLTQEELVDKCNLNVRTLQRIEAGEVTPRSYTVKAIFAALNYTFYDSFQSENKNSVRKESVFYNWLRQFYRYALDLFNLKTHTMKKITILSVLLVALVLGISAFFTDGQAQNDKSRRQVIDQTSHNEENKIKMLLTNFSCGECFNENDVMIGRDVKFKNNGVTFNVKLIRLSKSHEFNTGFAKGKFFQNKVEVSYLNGNVKYTADKVVVDSGSRIMLKGNGKLNSTQNETIEADEIIIWKN